MKIHVACLALLTGCSAAALQEDAPPIARDASLLRFSGCADLERYVEDNAVRDMTRSLRAILEYKKRGVPFVVASTEGPQSVTRTNVQLEGVDEADLVKADGAHLFVIAGGALRVVKSWPAKDLALLSSTPIEGDSRELFLDEARRLAVVFSTVVRPGKGLAMEAATKATILDVAEPSTPRVISEHTLPGWYRTSRRTGGIVRAVTTDAFRWPDGVRLAPEHEEGMWDDDARLEAAIDRTIDANTELIRARTLSDWLPAGAGCGDFLRPSTPAHLGFTAISTLDLDAPGESPARTAIVAEMSAVHASKDALYLASPHWWWWPAAGQVDHTYLHAFDLSGRDVVYLGSGGVDGHVLGQLSMDEHEGYLRVATTIGRRLEDDRVALTNAVSVLHAEEGALRLIGRTPDLAAGERIYAARFLGDRAFTVTFREVDPLIALDLSDPRAPRVAGELKVPGLSTYLHPLDGGHLLALGELPGEARVKLSVYDVRDLAAPKEVHSALLGGAYAWTDASADHHAFEWSPSRGLLALPMNDVRVSPDGPYHDTFASDLRVLEVGAASGIRVKGALDMAGVGDGAAWVRRGVLADDFVYAISDAGLRVAHVEDLASPLATVRFPPAR